MNWQEMDFTAAMESTGEPWEMGDGSFVWPEGDTLEGEGSTLGEIMREIWERTQ